jgi:DNA-binding SARP family transcriptional activator
LTRTGNTVRFDVLGPWEVKVGGAVVAIPHGRLTVLLAALLLSIDEYVSVETLAERLWSDHPPVRSRETLHTYVNRLRNVLGRDVIETGPGGGYRLRVDAANVDLYRFRALLRQAGEVGAVDRERRLLAAALELWRGKPFGDVESAWLDRDVVPRLTELWLTATERRIDLDLAAGPPGLVVAELWGLTSTYPTRESLWFRLVTALDRAGRRADALDAYEKARAALADELDVEPSEQLVQLSREILSTLVPNDDPAHSPARDVPTVRQPAAADPMEFGKLLRAHRNRLTWTQAELAARAGVSERTIHGLELGRSRPRRTTVELLA